VINRLAHLTVHHRRLVLAVSVGVLLGFLALAVGTFSVLKTGGFDDPKSDSTQANNLLDQNFGGQTDLVFLVSPTNPGRSVDDPAVAAAATAVTQTVTAHADVTGVNSYWTSHAPALRSTDGTGGLITAHVAGDEDASAHTAKGLIDEIATDNGTIRVRAGGPLGVGTDVTNQVAKDLALAESIAIPVTLVLLILAFGSLVAALLPLTIGLVAIAGTFAELNVLGHLTNVSTYAVNLTTALGLGLGIDYALLIVNRFREELARHGDTEAAVARTLQTAGGTVAVALAAMVIFPLYFLRSFAYAGIGVVIIAMITSLVTLPALLAVLGHRVNAGRIWRGRPLRPASEESPFWRRTAVTVMRRPLLIGLPVVAALLLIATPFLHIRFATPDDRVLPTSLDSRQVGDDLRTNFQGNAAALLYAVVRGPATPDQVAQYAATVSRLPAVTSVQDAAGSWRSGAPTPAPSTRFVSGDVQYLIVAGPPDGSSAAAQTLVHDIRNIPPPATSKVYLGGSPAQLVDSKSAIGSRLPYAIVWIALTTLVLLFLFTGSVLLPVKALILNALTMGAVFGVIVWVFQQGHLSSVFGFTPGPINTSMPILLFCIAFGLSMDYEVFLLSRIKELRDHGASNDEAVAAGLARTGRIITTAAALLSVTFFAFLTSKVSFLQLFGLGTGLAIVIDATVIRGVLVPAVMTVARDATWSAPPPLRRIHQRFGLSEAPAETERQPVPVG
jgi:putative drug exporter of the RND superfamily